MKNSRLKGWVYVQRESEGWKTVAAGQIREGGSHEREYKSKGNKKCKERCERGEREENRRGSTSRAAGPGSRRSSSGSGRTVNVILSSRLLEMQQPKLYSNLTFQKAQVDPTLIPFSSAPCTTHHFLPPLPFPICSLLSSSLIPVTSPKLLIYSFPLCSCYISLYYSRLLGGWVWGGSPRGNSPSFCLHPH